ncbi:MULTISPECIES: hypothetical protein [Clostridiaceae]|uniref:hypothetical protein n=1 Tax=Clostridiaceae TaxID=31979 RepID=UPI0006909E57|nr:MULTISPECIES: hypothetical protein [Clostridiaceae]
MTEMSNMFELMSVGSNCPEFSPTEGGLVSSVGSSMSKSCAKCKHFKNYKCDIDVYDKVVAGLDQA